jgi:hypothetical protein
MKSFLSVLVVLVSLWCSGQRVELDFSYTYIYANQFDKAIQNYNFSRPFLTEAQPLFKHGFSTDVAYFFPSDKKIQHGFQLGYSNFGSVAENENFNNDLQFHFFQTNYLLHLGKQESKFYTDFMVGLATFGLWRYINDESLIIDETPARAFGIGGQIGVKLGYRFSFNDKLSWSPFVRMGCAPLTYSPTSEALINQTKGLTGSNWSTLLTGDLGITFQFQK